MRILVLAGTFPPHVSGGAEVSCFNLTRLLAQRGHEMAVVTMAETDEDELWGVPASDGFRLYRIKFPRPSTLYSYPSVNKWAKPLWHLQDYVEPRNSAIIRSVLEDFKPDHVNIHLLTGLGYNMLNELARHKDVGVTYFLHDLGLACVKTTMFTRGKECEGQCMTCHAASMVKNQFLSRIDRLGFASPSSANLSRVARFLPEVAARPRRIIRNLLDELPPFPPYQAGPDGRIRLVYAGRLHPTKGVDVMLKALRPLIGRFDFQITIYGRGEQEDALRAEFGHESWVTFGGFVDRIEVARAVSQSELFCMPSVWPEPFGRTALQSLRLGTPVIGSSVGGIPELVEHERTGLLVAPGDVAALTGAFEQAFSDRNRLTVAWRRNALSFGEGFQTEEIAESYETFVKELHRGTTTRYARVDA